MFNSMKKGSSTVSSKINTKGFQIIKLSEATKSQIFGFIKTKDVGYGHGILLVLADKFVSLPKRYVDMFNGFDSDDIEALKSGNVYINNVRPIDTKLGKSTTFDFTDVDNNVL